MIGVIESPVLDRPGVAPDSPVQTYRGFERNRKGGQAWHLLFEADVQGQTRRLRLPVAVEIKTEEGVWFVENTSLNLFGRGASTEEALQDFRHHLSFFADRYLSLPPSEVIGEGKRLKTIYEKIFG